MIKDFDELRAERDKRDRTFRIGGEDFLHKATVAPEVILAWNEAISGEKPEMTERQWLDLYDETTLTLLEDGQEEKWARVRDPRAEKPLALGDLRALLTWLISQTTRLPTGEESASSSGSATTAPSSRAESSPKEGASATSTPESSAP